MRIFVYLFHLIQTLLATYFVFVDFSLLLQYFYYRRKAVPPPFIRRSRSRLASSTLGRSPTERLAPRYRTLSAVAVDVAAAAALAAQQTEQADPRYASSRRVGSTDYLPRRSSISYLPRPTIATNEDDGEGPEPIPAGMIESFHSEHLPGNNKRVSWSAERHARSMRGGSTTRSPRLSRSTLLPASLQVTPTPTDAFAGASTSDAALQRGRSMQREVDSPVHAPTESPERVRRSSRGTSRRSAGMVFLAVWALFSVGTLTGNNIQPSLINDRAKTGKVLYAKRLFEPIPDASLVPISSAVLPSSVDVVHDPTIHDEETIQDNNKLRVSHASPKLGDGRCAHCI